VEKINLSKDLLIADVMDRWPETIVVFLNKKMGCVGCSMAPFETLSEAANIYGLCCTRFINDLQARINSQEMA